MGADRDSLVKKVALKDIEVGMIVAEAVVSEQGDVLVKTGVELDDFYIKILTRYEIGFIYVKNLDEPEQEKSHSPEDIAKKKAEIEQRKALMFKNSLNNSYMQTLFEITCKIKLEDEINE